MKWEVGWEEGKLENKIVKEKEKGSTTVERRKVREFQPERKKYNLELLRIRIDFVFLNVIEYNLLKNISVEHVVSFQLAQPNPT